MVRADMRRALWLLSFAAGLVGLVLARRGVRPALPAGVTRALEPAVPRSRPKATPAAPAASEPTPPGSDVQRVRLPWADGHK